MNTYFNIRYELDREEVHRAIERRLPNPESDYICVADGVILNMVNRDLDYLKVVNGGLFSICDSSYVPIYLKLIYGEQYDQYCGAQIFEDIVRQNRYRMIFLGAKQRTLNGLRDRLRELNPATVDMKFVELPFEEVENFDYPAIARMIEEDGAEIIWVALGAPKQEIFMSRLKPYLHHGVMIAVGAAFKYFSGVALKRAPKWMVKCHLEFLYRLIMEPRKQAARCYHIVRTLPGLLVGEWRRKISSRRKERARQCECHIVSNINVAQTQEITESAPQRI